MTYSQTVEPPTPDGVQITSWCVGSLAGVPPSQVDAQATNAPPRIQNTTTAMTANLFRSTRRRYLASRTHVNKERCRGH